MSGVGETGGKYESGFLSPEIENLRNEICSKWVTHLPLIEKVSKTCHSYKSKLAIHLENWQEVCAAAVFLKIMSDVEGALVLLERGMMSQCRSLLRVAVEASITLAKICESYDFAKVYALSGEQVRLKMLKGIKETAHEELQSLKAEISDELVEDLYLQLK